MIGPPGVVRGLYRHGPGVASTRIVSRRTMNVPSSTRGVPVGRSSNVYRPSGLAPGPVAANAPAEPRWLAHAASIVITIGSTAETDERTLIFWLSSRSALTHIAIVCAPARRHNPNARLSVRPRAPGRVETPRRRLRTVPLLTERTPHYHPLGYRVRILGYHEQTHGPRPGHPGPPTAQDARPRADERLGDRAAAQRAVVRRPAGQRRLALSRAAQARAGGMDHRRVAAEREQSPRQVLFAHSRRPQATPDRSRQLGSSRRRHHGAVAPSAPSGGLT